MFGSSGTEASFIVGINQSNYVNFCTSQDHKQLYDNDHGPNTGGMGAFAPVKNITPDIESKIIKKIILEDVGINIEKNDESIMIFKERYPLIFEENNVESLIELNKVLIDDICLKIINKNISQNTIAKSLKCKNRRALTINNLNSL